jgi:hypothetical protein
MRITEIESQISNNYETIKTLQKQVADLSKKNFHLSQIKENKLTELFIDYIELGTTYTFNSYAYLTGVQTGVKTDFKSPNFQNGDVIRFDKKNKKSIVVTCLNKSEHKIANGVGSVSMSNTNLIFRIYIDSLYQFMLRSPDFKSRFDAYVRRKESLDLLGI